MNSIRILIVDDVERVRQDLCTFLTLSGDIEIVGEASNGLETVRLVESLNPDVVLMDLEMPILDGYEATSRIKAIRPSCRVIILSIHAGEVEQQRAFQSGADGFVMKGAPVETLLKTIRNTRDSRSIPKGEKT